MSPPARGLDRPTPAAVHEDRERGARAKRPSPRSPSTDREPRSRCSPPPASGPPSRVPASRCAGRVRSDPDELDPDRMSDVDEWGRSEHMRELARRLYDPVYRNWFRVEWEGLEKIPTDGGALLVANHAAAIPSDAPVIMHGIETELDRPVLRPGRQLLPHAAGRRHAVEPPGRPARAPRQRLPAAARPGAAGAGVPRGGQGPRQDLRRALPAAALRSGWLRRDRHARRRARRADRRGRRRGVHADAGAHPLDRPGARRCPTCPITANMLRRGPARRGRATSRPSSSCKVLDPVHFDVPPGQERYSRSRVMDESEAIRDRIQVALYEMLRTPTIGVVRMNATAERARDAPPGAGHRPRHLLGWPRRPGARGRPQRRGHRRAGHDRADRRAGAHRVRAGRRRTTRSCPASCGPTAGRHDHPHVPGRRPDADVAACRCTRSTSSAR